MTFAWPLHGLLGSLIPFLVFSIIVLQLDQIFNQKVSKNLYFQVKMYIWWFVTFYYLKKAPKSHFEPIYFAILVWVTYHPVEGAQHKKKLKIRHKWPYLMNT
jgi:hypothetical protein